MGCKSSFIFTKLNSGPKEPCQNANISAQNCSNMVKILVKISKKGDFENQKVQKCDLSTKSVLN